MNKYLTAFFFIIIFSINLHALNFSFAGESVSNKSNLFGNDLKKVLFYGLNFSNTNTDLPQENIKKFAADNNNIGKKNKPINYDAILAGGIACQIIASMLGVCSFILLGMGFYYYESSKNTYNLISFGAVIGISFAVQIPAAALLGIYSYNKMKNEE
jgi:hypothetical protein